MPQSTPEIVRENTATCLAKNSERKKCRWTTALKLSPVERGDSFHTQGIAKVVIPPIYYHMHMSSQVHCSMFLVSLMKQTEK